VETAHEKTDYLGKFFWIDFIQPVSDPLLADRLQDEVLSRIRNEDLDAFDLAPPEILDWTRVSNFLYPFDVAHKAGSSSVFHPDLRLIDFVSGLKKTGRLASVTGANLRTIRISAVDGSGSHAHQWSVWKCLVGQLALDGETYVLDEGDFFRVQDDYVLELNQFVDNLTSANISFPNSTPTKHEAVYNSEFANISDDYFLLDKRLVSIRAKTTPIEICDVLTKNRQLIHIKRHLGSSDLSHLFSQGLVSAELLQSSPEFRTVVSRKIRSYVKGRSGFDCFSTSGFVASEFEIVFGIIERWKGKSCSEALPFFSKVNLREVANNLSSRGFKVALNQIQA
jgi:uncharacterized protein (TIGR04141 family)